MLLSAVSFLVVAQSSSEIPEELMNNPVYFRLIPILTESHGPVIQSYHILNFQVV